MKKKPTKLISSLLILLLCAVGYLFGGTEFVDSLLGDETGYVQESDSGYADQSQEYFADENEPSGDISQADANTSEKETVTETTARETEEKVTVAETTVKETGEKAAVTEDGKYTSKDEVALYIHLYGHLPSNFITKKEAEEAGWESSKGNLWEVTDGMSIGGTRFGNYEGQLPDKSGRKWYECDVNYQGGYRGEERIVYSNDGLIYYTNDHYETFTQLY